MKLTNIIAATYPKGQKPNAEQLKAIRRISGPLLIVAGPGSGKTKTMITRTLNLLLNHRVAPEKILLCTFTEKAARQLRDRVNAGLNHCKATGVDIHEMTIGTIHSVCQGIIDEYPNETGIGVYSKTRGLGRGYAVLDELQRTFFLMDNFDTIYGATDGDGRYLGLWKGFWGTIERSQEYFDKITEEYVDLNCLTRSADPVVKSLGKAMKAYRRLQVRSGKIDFSHLEWLAMDLLSRHAPAKREFQSKFEYVMVDEYQDTNYIQEQIIFRVANAAKNIAVVGDVDQSIYRFRGATTQNIMEFANRVGKAGLKPIHLETNYRSAQQIVDLYQGYRDECDWDGHRYPLGVKADLAKETKRPTYGAVVKIEDDDAAAEGAAIGGLIRDLKRAGTIEDYNQVAILLYSVRSRHSEQYIDAIRALRDKGEAIDVYAPRARMFFERPEVMCALAGLHAINRVKLSSDPGGFPNAPTESVKEYLGRCVRCFRSQGTEDTRKSFAGLVTTLKTEIKALVKRGGTPKRTFLDYFYGVINSRFMERWLDEELPARHLAQISNLITTFSEYYGYDWIGGKNADAVWDRFFNSFLRVLYEGGLNEYEDEEQAFPSGAVQVMTYHQAKGLEFPVVIVGDLHAQIRTGKKVDALLGSYYQRPLHEPVGRISEFDKRRLYYVAFSRAKDFLVLTGHKDLTDKVAKRKEQFEDVLKGAESWASIKRKRDYKKVRCEKGDDEALKPVFGFTSHISAYERCPRQFRYQKLYGFVPARNEQFWMGNVVHNTLKDIHDHVLKRKAGKLEDALVKDYLSVNIDNLRRQGIDPPKLSEERRKRGEKPLEQVALESVLRYVRQSRAKLKHCRWAEKEILVDEKDYSLTGVIDLLIDDDKRYVELVDFKAGRQKSNEQYRQGYHDQVRLYCKQAEHKLGKVPDEGYLYWITEPDGVDPKDAVDIAGSLLSATRSRVNSVAKCILDRRFPKLGKRVEDVCGICEFDKGCWG